MEKNNKKIMGTFDIDTVEKLAKIVNENSLSEITLDNDGVKVTIKAKIPPVAPMPPIMPLPSFAPAPNAPSVPAQPVANNNNAVSASKGTAVKAPIVGTFYAAASPNAKPFVSKGQHIKKGDIIYIIESKKVMNEVKSEVDGVVSEICVSNGDPVEFDQTVMYVE